MSEDEVTLWAEDPELSHKDFKDPGLFPDYWHFHANSWTRYMGLMPDALNHLLSAYHLQEGAGLRRLGIASPQHARVLFLDSGCITPLIACLNGKMERDEVARWLTRTGELVERAWELSELGCDDGVLGSMDLPRYGPALDAAGFTTQDALEVTQRNALALSEAKLPPGWRPAYMLQGSTVDDYVSCARLYKRHGLLEGDAWISVGGTRDRKPPALYSIYRGVREVLGPDVHVHALGVSRRTEVCHMAARGWIDGSDSSSSMREVVTNSGVYHTDGPRFGFLLDALFMANALGMDAELARAITKAKGEPQYEQEMLV